jgi:hypothetical protein
MIESKWIKARFDLRNPCDGGGCQAWIYRGDWYYRDGINFHLCEGCASGATLTQGGVVVEIGYPPKPV